MVLSGPGIKLYNYKLKILYFGANSNHETMAYKKQIDFEMVLGDVINDEIELRLVLEGLENFDEEEAQPSKSKQSSMGSRLTDGIRSNIQELANREQFNFRQELDIEGGRRYRNFKPYETEKFKLLGYNQEGKPLFKFSDLFLTSDPKVTYILNKHFDQIIHGSSKAVVLETGELSKKYDKGYDFSKLVENWEKKQYEDFTNDKKNKMNQRELEEIVVNRGDSKDNYWIYKVGERKKYEYQDIYQHEYYSNRQKSAQNPTEYYNHNLLNPQFAQNLNRAADRIRLQYAKIEQFESDQEKVVVANQNNNKEMQQQSQNKSASDTQIYWGELKEKEVQVSREVNNPVKTVLLEEQIKEIATTAKKDANGKSLANISAPASRNNYETLVDQIIKDYNIVNHEIINTLQGPANMKEYNRIEFHLENPNFFLTKLHYALQKKSEQLFNMVQGSGKNVSELPLNRNISAPSAFGDRSIISGSRTPNQQTIRASHIEGQESNQDDDHQTIEGKISREMSLQPKKPINHSQVATKLHFIKFSNELDHFKNFHRHQFRFDAAFDKKTRISLMRNLKPLKCKGTDFNINVEKKDSYTKFSKAESLSLASGDIKEFIMIEYIEETPLLMSDVGMCERMILQVNNKEMLQKINRDIIQENQIDIYEDMRDNPNNKENTTTQYKMELWRKNIKNNFGENGKVYLWEPKRQSKLIGNPEGLGVALMESNLAAMPIVKKTPSKRDFLLVREKDKWVLRKIDSLYVSGQVEPKQVVFSPGDRPYQTFLQKYQVDFLTKFALNSPNNKISIEAVKNYFPNTPQTSAQSRIRKILKQRMNSETKDNKTYQIKLGENEEVKFKLEPEQFCLFQRMQKSLCELEDCGIQNMRSMEKMKSILRKYFRKGKNKDLEHFAVARMIRDQLQLTSWYLTQSFRKFIDKNARIEMVGHADPTNGHGGYSFIKKPQKQRTDKDEAQQKQQKIKLSGTQYDLRKLKTEESVALLEQLGYSRQELQKLGRWELVYLLKGQKDTQYSRKERQNKELKEENERKERSKALNTLLKYLKNEEQGLIEPYEYNFNFYLDLKYYCDREANNWQIAKQKNLTCEDEELEDGGDDED